jgi:hypothetical protein
VPLSPTSTAIIARLRAAGRVFAEDEARLLSSTAQTPEQLAAMVDRRVAGVPLEQVLGWAEFCGLRIAVEPGVFVPRRRTPPRCAAPAATSPPPVVGCTRAIAPSMASGVDRPNARRNGAAARSCRTIAQTFWRPGSPVRGARIATSRAEAGRKARRNRDRHHPPGAQPGMENR